MNSYEQTANHTKRAKKQHNFAERNVKSAKQVDDPYKLLRLAIIRQAAKDTHSEHSPAYKFWTSDWYDLLSTGIEGFDGCGEKIRDQLVATGGLHSKYDD